MYPGSSLPMNLTYGVECHTHDACASAWCQSKWCYVGESCDLAHSFSSNVMSLRYSYATCGYQNLYTTALLEDSLAQADIKVVYLTNSGGWKGSYCTSNKTCQGPVFDFVSTSLLANVRSQDVMLTSLANVRMDIDMYPEEVVALVYDVDPNMSSVFTTCVYATHLGYVDICIGEFALTPSRVQLTSFVPIFSEPVYLITSTGKEDDGLWFMLTDWSTPFEPKLWVTLVAAHIVLAFVVVAHERYDGGSLEGLSWPKATRVGLFQSFGSIFGVSGFAPTNFGGKTATLAAGILVLFSTATYTANLASQLVVSTTTVADIQSMDDVKRVGASVCLSESLAYEMQVNTGLPSAQMVVKDSRADVVPGITAGECDAAVMKHEDLQAAQTAGDFCDVSTVGGPLFSINNGVPVSDRYHKHFHYMFTTEYAEGRWQETVNRYETTNLCDTSTTEETPSLKVSGFLGVFVIVSALVLLSFLTHWRVLEASGTCGAEAGGACQEQLASGDAGDGREQPVGGNAGGESGAPEARPPSDSALDSVDARLARLEEQSRRKTTPVNRPGRPSKNSPSSGSGGRRR